LCGLKSGFYKKATMMATFSFHLIALLCLFVFVIIHAEEEGDHLPMSFLEACTHGDVEQVRKDLLAHPSYATGRSPQGETCLHVAGIEGQPEVTRIILAAGGDPNTRSTSSHGQRMHPLSWNTYGGHVEVVKILLEKGANVNLDIDWPVNGSKAKATCLDILDTILPKERPTEGKELTDTQKYYDLMDLLIENGGKRYSDLETDSEL
jgi:hypothetical protein